MGLYLDYSVPRHVRAAIDGLTVNQLWDLCLTLGIDEGDLGEGDKEYDFVRERIYDFLYNPKRKS